MSISISPSGIDDGGSTRLIVNNGVIKVAENQAAVAGQLYHFPVSGFLPRAWGNHTFHAYAEIGVSGHGASGSTSWTSSDAAGHPGATLAIVNMDAGHTRELWSLNVHCCAVSYVKLAGVSTYGTTSFTSSSTNTGPFTFSWTNMNFTGHNANIKFFSMEV